MMQERVNRLRSLADRRQNGNDEYAAYHPGMIAPDSEPESGAKSQEDQRHGGLGDAVPGDLGRQQHTSGAGGDSDEDDRVEGRRDPGPFRRGSARCLLHARRRYPAG